MKRGGAQEDADQQVALIAGLDRGLAHGDEALVSNRRLPALREDHGIRQLLDRLRQGRGGFEVRRAVRLRTNAELWALQVVLRYPELAGGGGHIQNHQGAAHHAADLPQNRCGRIRGHIFCSFLAVLLRKGSCSTASPLVTAISNGSTSSMIDELSEIEVEQDGRRASCCEPPQAPRSIPYARPWHYVATRLPGDPARARTSPIVWCLKRPMARKPLMHNYIYFETLELGWRRGCGLRFNMSGIAWSAPKLTVASDDSALWRHVEQAELESQHQSDGYFDVIMRVRRRTTPSVI